MVWVLSPDWTLSDAAQLHNLPPILRILKHLSLLNYIRR